MIAHTGNLLIAIELPIKLTNKNDGRGGSFWRSAKERKQIEAILRASGHVYEPLDRPVELRVTRLIGKRERPWDYSSGLRGNFKEIEDSMVACGWFHDDGPEWIRGITFDQARSDDGRSAVRIEIFEAV